MRFGSIFSGLLTIGTTASVLAQPSTPDELAEASRKVKIEFARYDELYHAIRTELGAPDVFHPDLSKTLYGAQIQSTIGDESGFIFSMSFEDEASLFAASKSGLLDDLAQVCLRQLRKRFDMKNDAEVKVRFNSFEYTNATGDGFHRVRDGDWRTDFEVVLSVSGEKITNAPNP